MAAAVLVREPPAEEGPAGAPQEQGGGDEALADGVQVEPARADGHVHVGQGAGDDSGVVAEEERAERGDERHEADGAALARWGSLVDQGVDLGPGEIGGGLGHGTDPSACADRL